MSTTWRIFGIATEGGPLVLASIQVMEGGEVRTPVSITASHAPLAGHLLDLLDAVNLAGEVVFAAADAHAPGFYIDIAFAVPVSVDGLRLGIGASVEGFPLCVAYGVVQAGRVASPQRIEEIIRPSAHTAVTINGGDPDFGAVELLLPFTSDVLDRSTKGYVTEKIGVGGVGADALALGGGSLALNGSTGVRVVPAAAFSFLHDNTTDYTLELEFFHARSSATQVLFATALSSSDVGMFLGLGVDGVPYFNIFRGVNGHLLSATASLAASVGVYNILRFIYRIGAVISIELNGAVIFSGQASGFSGFPGFSTASPTNALSIGLGFVGGASMAGMVGRAADARITKGVVRTGIKTAPWPRGYAQGVKAARLQTATSQMSEVRGLPVVDGSATQLCAMDELDMEHGGNGVIHGTVELYAQAGNMPLPRRVRLQRSRDSLLVRETWSDAQGNYRFDHITDRYKYDVIAWDHEGLQQSVVANDLTPQVTP